MARGRGTPNRGNSGNSTPRGRGAGRGGRGGRGGSAASRQDHSMVEFNYSDLTEIGLGEFSLLLGSLPSFARLTPLASSQVITLLYQLLFILKRLRVNQELLHRIEEEEVGEAGEEEGEEVIWQILLLVRREVVPEEQLLSVQCSIRGVEELD